MAPRLPRFSSAADLIAAQAADVLVLATPPHVHVEDAQRASAAGIPTLVEKPPGRTAEEASLLAGLDPPPWIAFNRRFDEGIDGLRHAMRGASRFALRLTMTIRDGGWGAYDVRDPVLLDLGPHLVDLALWLSGEMAEKVTGDVQRDSASISIQFPGGSALIECTAGRRHRERFEVRTDRGRVRYRAGAVWRKSPLVPSLTRQLEAFARAARGHEEPVLATAAEGVDVMRILDAAATSPRNLRA